jgi:septal ring factor EnvC (AmiA/AmiB activator)
MMLVASHEEIEGCLDDGMPDSIETKEKVMEAEVEIEVEDKKDEEKEAMEANYAQMKMECEKLTAELAEMKASKEAVETGRVAVEAKLAEVETQLVNANNEVANLKASLETASNQLKSHREQEVKSMLVGSVMDESEFEAQKATLVALPNDVLALMGRKPKVEEKPRMSAAVETPDDKTVKIVL